MEIYQVSIALANNKPYIADVSIVIYGNITISGIKLFESKRGIYVKWPRCMCFGDADVKKKMSSRILATYVLNIPSK